MERKNRRKRELYTIKDFHQTASDRAGRCLSTEYTRMKDLYEWQCGICGHIWRASFMNIQSGTWCPKCAGNLKGTIKEMQKIATEKNGECLSSIYFNKKNKLLWKCELGHKFQATADSIKNQGSWCNHPDCTSSPRYDLKRIQDIAISKGGQCLSTEYINCETNMEWKCEKGHKWKTPAKYILKGHWCHSCNIAPSRDLIYLQEIANSRKGKLISTIYNGMKHSYEWECEEGHQWFAPAGAVAKGRWCKHYYKGNIEEFHEIAKLKGGICLSTSYVDRVTLLKFECKEGHQFFSIPTNVKNRNAWCPYCKNTWEERTRLIFEKLLQIPFKKTRKVLGDNLELDGYNDAIKVAFEYQGEQHFIFNKHFHGNSNGFLHQILSDLETKHRCKDNKIKLIIVPYFENERLVDYIKTELIMLGIPFKENVNIDFNEIYMSKNRIEEFSELAKSKNGKLVSTTYIDSYTKLHFECENKHSFYLLPYTAKNGRWCKECNKEPLRQKQLKRLKKIVSFRKGRLISTQYINRTTHLDFECEHNHTWSTSPAVIFKGHWCPKCARI